MLYSTLDSTTARLRHDALPLGAFVVAAVVKSVAGVRGVEVRRVHVGRDEFEGVAGVEHQLAAAAPDAEGTGAKGEQLLIQARGLVLAHGVGDVEATEVGIVLEHFAFREKFGIQEHAADAHGFLEGVVFACNRLRWQ